MGWNWAMAMYADAAVPQYESDSAADASALSAEAFCGHWERRCSACAMTSSACPFLIIDGAFIERTMPCTSPESLATGLPFPYFLNCAWRIILRTSTQDGYFARIVAQMSMVYPGFLSIDLSADSSCFTKRGSKSLIWVSTISSVGSVGSVSAINKACSSLKPER